MKDSLRIEILFFSFNFSKKTITITTVTTTKKNDYLNIKTDL